MDTDAPVSESTPPERAVPEKAGSPPPTICSEPHPAAERDISVAKQTFEFRTKRNGVRVFTRDMVDYLAVKAHFDAKSLAYFTFYQNCMKPIKAVFRNLSHNAPA
jgi:hypothetical protein